MLRPRPSKSYYKCHQILHYRTSLSLPPSWSFPELSSGQYSWTMKKKCSLQSVSYKQALWWWGLLFSDWLESSQMAYVWNHLRWKTMTRLNPNYCKIQLIKSSAVWDIWTSILSYQHPTLLQTQARNTAMLGIFLTGICQVTESPLELSEQAPVLSEPPISGLLPPPERQLSRAFLLCLTHLTAVSSRIYSSRGPKG